MEGPVVTSNVRYVGFDVHKDSIVMPVAESGNAEAKLLGTFPNDTNKIIRQLKKLSPDFSLLRSGADRFWYESASEEGRHRLHRRCAVAGSAEVRPANQDRSKRFEEAGSLSAIRDLTEVWVPDEQDGSVARSRAHSRRCQEHCKRQEGISKEVRDISWKALQPTDSFHKQREASQQRDRAAGS